MFDKLKNMFKKKAPVPAEPDRSMLVPRIKHAQFVPDFRATMKQMGVPVNEVGVPHTEPLAVDLVIAYAFDMGDAFRFVSAEDIAQVGVRLEDAREVAIENLRRQIPQIGIAEHGPVRQIVTGENLEACLLLASAFWDDTAATLGGELIVAVPSRDVLLFCGGDSVDGVELMRELIPEAMQEADNHALSDRLYAWREHRWTAYEG